jgi:hypothetical protein
MFSNFSNNSRVHFNRKKCSSSIYLWLNAPRAMVDVDVGIYPRINDPLSYISDTPDTMGYMMI